MSIKGKNSRQIVTPLSLLKVLIFASIFVLHVSKLLHVAFKHSGSLKYSEWEKETTIYFCFQNKNILFMTSGQNIF